MLDEHNRVEDSTGGWFVPTSCAICTGVAYSVCMYIFIYVCMYKYIVYISAVCIYIQVARVPRLLHFRTGREVGTQGKNAGWESRAGRKLDS